MVTELGRPKSAQNIVDSDLQADPNVPDPVQPVEPGTPLQLIISNLPDAENTQRPPLDVYSCHHSEILQRRWEVKAKTLEKRKRFNSTIRRRDVRPENFL
ncbi:MAG: hypothetical protein HOC20_06305 [Chloroflexi bacterium]|nr:hypothetical protein [Chloroflexota bacterium]